MKKWTLLVLAMIFAMGAFQSAKAQNKKASNKEAASAAPGEPPIAKNWKESKEALNSLAAKFRDPKLTKAQKVELLPASNNLLFDAQQLKLSKAEKAEQIQVIVNFLAATNEADFANSNTDSVFDDFKVNKKTYMTEIAKIKDKKTRQEIIDAFDGWAQAETDAKKADSEEDEGAAVPEAEH